MEKNREKSGLPPSCPAEASTTACLWRKNTVQWSKDPAPDRGQSRAGAGRKEANMEEQSRRLFGTMPDGTQVEEITLRSGGLTAGILTYGGAVRTLTVPGRSGAPVDVALGFDSLEDYRRQDKYLGALVGRVANRIGGRPGPAARRPPLSYRSANDRKINSYLLKRSFNLANIS